MPRLSSSVLGGAHFQGQKNANKYCNNFFCDKTNSSFFSLRYLGNDIDRVVPRVEALTNQYCLLKLSNSEVFLLVPGSLSLPLDSCSLVGETNLNVIC